MVVWVEAYGNDRPHVRRRAKENTPLLSLLQRRRHPLGSDSLVWHGLIELIPPLVLLVLVALVGSPIPPLVLVALVGSPVVLHHHRCCLLLLLLVHHH